MTANKLILDTTELHHWSKDFEWLEAWPPVGHKWQIDFLTGQYAARYEEERLRLAFVPGSLQLRESLKCPRVAVTAGTASMPALMYDDVSSTMME